MINNICCIPRNTYLINTGLKKKDNNPLNKNDYLNIGYMAGRFGINLLNPNEANPIKKSGENLLFSINSCTSSLFENNLKNSGINFERII